MLVYLTFLLALQAKDHIVSSRRTTTYHLQVWIFKVLRRMLCYQSAWTQGFAIFMHLSGQGKFRDLRQVQGGKNAQTCGATQHVDQAENTLEIREKIGASNPSSCETMTMNPSNSENLGLESKDGRHLRQYQIIQHRKTLRHMINFYDWSIYPYDVLAVLQLRYLKMFEWNTLKDTQTSWRFRSVESPSCPTNGRAKQRPRSAKRSESVSAKAPGSEIKEDAPLHQHSLA